ncbi:MAG TPA: peptidoglycan editing factor PgeF [Kineosporiaceae bacterium]|nr:peptidoglycan editing factor PgeF [Kineosporiaceae bacterium]
MAEVDLPVLEADLGLGVIAFFTCRSDRGATGRRPTGGYGDFNLALHVGDDPAQVAARRRRLAERVGAPVLFARQVHGTRVAVVDARSSRDPYGGDLGQHEGGYDALTTAGPQVGLAVLVADCVPVLLADPRAGVVAAAHAGRNGLLAGVLGAVLAAMIARGARPERIRAALGPCAGGCCYEVPEQMQHEAAAVLPATRSRTRRGTPSLDLRAGCRSVLESAGVAAVQLVGGCTIEDEALYSYRRAPVTGRFAGVVKMIG